MDAKKYPALTATLAVFGLVALTGLVLAGVEIAGFSSASDKLAATDRTVTQLLGETTAPTAENKAAAQANLDALKAAEEAHLKDLAGPKAGEFTDNLVSDPGQFTSNLNASVTAWRKSLNDAGILLVSGRAGAKPEDFAFGFSRYFKTGVNPQQRFTQSLSRQAKIVDFLIRTVVEVKGQDALRLVAVDREPVELEGSATVRNNSNPDEITGLNDPTFRHEGVVRGEFFRVRFVGGTPVLRRFVNAISGSGRAIVVRGVEVTPASAELLAAPQAEGEAGANNVFAGSAASAANVFGDAAPAGDAAAAAAAPAGPQVVVGDGPSDISVTLEFIEASKPKPVSSEPAATETANK